MEKNYKLKSPIKEFIIRLAGEHPELGCRKIALLVSEESGKDISKSSVSSLLKSQGLSQAVGRRRLNGKTALSPEPFPQPSVIPGPAISQGSSRQALGLKFILEDKSHFFIDAALCSIWASQHIPPDFCAAADKARGFLRGMLTDNEPLVLLSPGGSQEPPAELLNFIEGFQADNPAKAIRAIELYGNKNEAMEAINAIPAGRHYFVLGIWPWQYAGHPAITVLRTVNYKKNERDILALVTNLPGENWDEDKIISLYLWRWPDPELQYKEFLNKVIEV